jgi:hypothetical protein
MEQTHSRSVLVFNLGLKCFTLVLFLLSKYLHHLLISHSINECFPWKDIKEILINQTTFNFQTPSHQQWNAFISCKLTLLFYDLFSSWCLDDLTTIWSYCSIFDECIHVLCVLLSDLSHTRSQLGSNSGWFDARVHQWRSSSTLSLTIYLVTAYDPTILHLALH